TPCDFKSTCPSCSSIYPSNNLMNNDFTSGNFADDGYGYFDKDGHIFLFAATYHRDQCRAFGTSIGALTTHLRKNTFDEEIARKLGILLLRYAVEECYVASSVQFRYGPSRSVEQPWDWGQPDWADESDPVAALARKGSIRYSIDTPKVGEFLALAYDTIWPLVREDQELVSRGQALGLNIQSPTDTANLMEEMLASMLQVVLDRAASSNLPRESVGALTLLRGLDRPDAQSAMDWLYDEGPDTLRVFTTNDFFPDGTPPESTGGYNSIHTNGLFEVEHNLRHFRNQHPEKYTETRYPSLVSDPRTANVARQPNEIPMIGKSYFQFGDGHAPGTGAERLSHPDPSATSIRLTRDCFHAPMQPETLSNAVEFTGDPIVKEIYTAVQTGKHRHIGTTIHDGVGIAILRTPETPERAAVGIVYGDTTGHRHRDLMDVQLFAFERPFLTDLGYPQNWASRPVWEDHWATHNTVWGDLADESVQRVPGRGRLLRTLFLDGLQILDIEADRWTQKSGRWTKLEVTYRRLIALVETDDDGVVLVDLSRVTGGIEHWRTCRGLEGEFLSDTANLKPRNGTVANSNGKRGDTRNMDHPDHAAQAYMDDVATAQAPSAWKGAWQSSVESAAHLDLHQLRVSPNTELLTARATAVVGTPEESSYNYRTVLWRRKPQNDTTCVDLVFEPRVGDATLKIAQAISADTDTASGVRLTTRQGKQVDIYWAPSAKPGDVTKFENGARLQGSLAAVVNGKLTSVGATEFHADSQSYTTANAVQTGRIVAVDRPSQTIDVEGLNNIATGDRIVINPDGRGHNYRVESATPAANNIITLKLDVTSILGRATVISAGKNELDLGFNILTRTGNLNRTRAQSEKHGFWGEIAAAANPERDRTVLQLEEGEGQVDRLNSLDAGEWVQVVDYVVGDTVRFEQTGKA
ncbi:MAG: hypothetical protein O2954_09925, partial [bacterium]|nr:hypothetical protein [bacterium]